jgi:hypothetical protein
MTPQRVNQSRDTELQRENVLSSTESRPALGATQVPIKFVPVTISSRMKWPGLEAGNSSPSTAEVKNVGTIPPLPYTLYGILIN